MKLLLEQWQEFLSEDAVEDISDMGLYLEDNFVVIYKAQPMMAKIRKSVYEDPDEYDITDDFVGVARLGFRDGNATVEEIWAVKGYGPTLYRIAMERAGHHGLSPSKIRGEVSDEASNVWKNFRDGKGQDYASFTPYDSPIHGKEHLDGVYHSKGAPIDKSSALNNHAKLFDKRRDPYEELLTHFVETADSLLRDKVQL